MDQSRGRRGHDLELARAVGQTIKVLRTDQAVDRKELAERAGISYSYLAEIERGNKPASNTVLTIIALELGLELHELLAYAEARRRSGRVRQSPSEPPPAFGASPGEAHSPSQSRPHPGTPSARRNHLIEPALRSSGADASYPPPEAQGQGARGWTTEEAVLQEIQHLVERLGPEDRERVLDLVRRLSR